MSFDPNQPLDDIYIVDLPYAIRNNFIGIQQGSDSFSMNSCNFSSIGENSLPEPEATATIGKVYMKEDQYGNQNLFASLPPLGTPSYPLTLFPPQQVKLIGSRNDSLELFCTFLPGGMMMAFGSGQIVNQQVFAFTPFAEVLSIVGSGLREVNTLNEGAFGVVFVPIKTSEYNPKNSFQITINRDDTKSRGVSLVLLGFPSADFLKSSGSSTQGAS